MEVMKALVAAAVAFCVATACSRQPARDATVPPPPPADTRDLATLFSLSDTPPQAPAVAAAPDERTVTWQESAYPAQPRQAATLLEAADPGARPAGALRAGEAVRVTGYGSTAGGAPPWLRVVTEDGRAGYARLGQFEFDPALYYGADTYRRIVSGESVTSANSYELAKIRELTVLRKGAPARRQGPVLALQTAGGESYLLDSPAAGQGGSSRYFCLVAMLDAVGAYVVHVQFWEGGMFRVVDRAGRWTLDLWGEPVPSPGGLRIAVAALLYGGPAVIEAYRRDTSGWVREVAATSPAGSGGSGLRVGPVSWVDDTHFEVRVALGEREQAVQVRIIEGRGEIAPR
jgi:hypothetical protein